VIAVQLIQNVHRDVPKNASVVTHKRNAVKVKRKKNAVKEKKRNAVKKRKSVVKKRKNVVKAKKRNVVKKRKNVVKKRRNAAKVKKKSAVKKRKRPHVVIQQNNVVHDQILNKIRSLNISLILFNYNVIYLLIVNIIYINI
jgi:hypothetical protein